MRSKTASGCDRIVVLRIFELLFCIACVVYKKITDAEAGRTFYLLEKLSREWPLLNNITWEQNGAAYTDIVFGGYVIIVTGLLIGQLAGELGRPGQGKIMERFFLGLGALFFIIVGSLVYAALDSVPHDLVDNSAVLGTLSLVTGLLFLLDMGLSRPKPPPPEHKGTQTEPPRNGVIKELKSSLKQRRPTEEPEIRPSQDMVDSRRQSLHTPGMRSASDGDLDMQTSHVSETFTDSTKAQRKQISSSADLPRESPRNEELEQPNAVIFPPSALRREIEEVRFLPERRSRLPLEQEHQMPLSILAGSRRKRETVQFPRDEEMVAQESPSPPRRTSPRPEVQRFPSDLDLEHHFPPYSKPLKPSPPPPPPLMEPKTKTQPRFSTGTDNSNSSSGEQQYLEQSEISQRPESITPEHQKSPTVPSVSFLLDEQERNGRNGLLTMPAIEESKQHTKDHFLFRKRSSSPQHWRFDSRDANAVPRPTSPSDAGYVRHTAQHWSEPSVSSRSPVESPRELGKTSSRSSPEFSEGASSQRLEDIHSPRQQSPEWSSQSVSQGGSPENWPDVAAPSSGRVYGRRGPNWRPSTQDASSASPSHRREQVEQEPEEEDDDAPIGGSLTTSLLQKWLKQRKTKFGKSKSNP